MATFCPVSLFSTSCTKLMLPLHWRSHMQRVITHPEHCHRSSHVTRAACIPYLELALAGRCSFARSRIKDSVGGGLRQRKHISSRAPVQGAELLVAPVALQRLQQVWLALRGRPGGAVEAPRRGAVRPAKAAGKQVLSGAGLGVLHAVRPPSVRHCAVDPCAERTTDASSAGHKRRQCALNLSVCNRSDAECNAKIQREQVTPCRCCDTCARGAAGEAAPEAAGPGGQTKDTLSMVILHGIA